jgi:hypothetical protein
MTAHSFRLLIPFLLASLPVPARPLDAQALVPDTRVQIRQCPPKGIPGQCVTTQGTFLAMSGDSLTLRESSGMRSSVAWSPTSRVRVSRGTHGYVVQGAILGLFLGLIVAKAVETSPTEDCEIPCGIAAPIGAVVGGVAMGALVGAMVRTEGWAEIDRPQPAGGWSFASVNLSLPTRSRPAGIGLRFAF